MVNLSPPTGGYRNRDRAATPSVPKELIEHPRWVCWRYNADKSKKPPVDPAKSRSIDWKDPGNWLSFERAVAAFEEHGHAGIGFVLTPDDPFIFIDLDDVRDPDTGRIEPWALEIVRTFSSYTEVSPSGRGLRIAVRGKLPFTKKGTKPIEIFSQDGYVTITGDALEGHDGAIEERQEELEDLYARPHFSTTTAKIAPPAPLRDPIDLTDDELLEKARNAKFGREFSALFDAGDTSAFGDDESRADYALARQLRYWTGGDPDRMERLFSLSALGQREKWKNRPDYRRRHTINNALKAGGKLYEPEKHRPKETRTRDRIAQRVFYAKLCHPWKEIAGRADAAASDRLCYLALLRLAWKANREEIDAGYREVMEEMGISDDKTALQKLARLHDLHGLVEKVRDGDNASAARYRLKTVPKPQHTEIGKKLLALNPPCVDNVCAGLLGAHLIRNPSPVQPDFDKNGRKIPKGKAPPVKSVGQAAAWVADVIHALAPFFAPGPVPRKFVAEITSIASNHLHERYIGKLIEAGLVVEVEGGYLPPEDATEALKRELRDSGSIDALNHQRRRHDRERAIRQVKRLALVGHAPEEIAGELGLPVEEVEAVLAPPDPVPSVEEMDAARLARSADGGYAELVPESPVWTDTFPDPGDAEQPLGHDHQEAPREPVTASEDPPKGTAPPAMPEATGDDTEAPCPHSFGGHVCPGGRGCYCCDKNHPMRTPVVLSARKSGRSAA